MKCVNENIFFQNNETGKNQMSNISKRKFMFINEQSV